MKFIADFHIHSRYSRATSRALTIENLYKWAQLKGLQVIGTGDLSHPGWLEEIQEKLEPDGSGLFCLKKEYADAVQSEICKACRQPLRFMLSGEISNIYKKHGKTRKNHNIVFLPSFEAASTFQAALERIGNIRSDGRPILGLDARDLLEIVLETDPQAHLIPAHIWTPWFSLFGSKSGFDAIEDCFEDLTPHIFALETGLSSDPPMNWRISALDRYTLVSNSDAHSAQKLAREANLFDTELSYHAIFDALKTSNSERFLGTIEFFPEEGKYHLDGHRKCGIRWDPKTTLEHKSICPVCGRPVTVGVSHRVEVLADRPEGAMPESAAPFYRLIPLVEILSEGCGVGPASKRVMQSYEALLTQLGSELAILLDLPVEALEKAGGALLAEGVRRMRSGEVIAEGGFDGEFGAIRLFEAQERESFALQTGLLPGLQSKQRSRRKKSVSASVASGQASRPVPPLFNKEHGVSRKKNAYAQETDSAAETDSAPSVLQAGSEELLAVLNPEQREAVLCSAPTLIISAGPGTGKTRTLTHRMAYLVKEQLAAPEQLLAMTFSNKAADEMIARLKDLLGPRIAARILVKTFHAFCAMVLRERGDAIGVKQNFCICSDRDRRSLLKQLYPDLKKKLLTQYLDGISILKNRVIHAGDTEAVDQFLPQAREKHQDFFAAYQAYERALQERQLLDFDGLILAVVTLFEAFPEILSEYQQRFRWISVDEYQDLNAAQYTLLKRLKGPALGLCVIGDPDQAIYGFRGASREYFLQFRQDFPDAVAFHLTRNYRSTQLILNASHQVISHASDPQAMELWSDIVSRSRVEIYEAPTYKAEAEYVVHEIEKMLGGTSSFSLNSGRVEDDTIETRSFGDFAVLYRLGAQSHALSEAFQRSGIPCQIVGQASLYEHNEIREILACLWLLHNPDADFYDDQVAHPLETRAFLEELRPICSSLRVADLVGRIAEFCMARRVATAASKQEDRIKALLRRAVPFETRLQDFLETTALRKEIDEYDPRAERVTLMTLHASKGLEFPIVFMTGCEETILPYQRDGKKLDLEEERRLFYVGMTRAQEKLILMRAKKRFLFGQSVHNPPSRFLNDIEDALKAIRSRHGKGAFKRQREHPQLALF
ncbi:hypothetical protein CSB45_12405 [candidate division KSB3 bacterium]|uniref:DNA 3'-5' helicase n=1 Tax=candidate division KSB3 bacterium TaxID=2044937 RepID=A0A2G6E261_9BACT|nr:MAG: hypothetical protein CSB45_12405 [candidate division KSB3 bacterium]PIE28697.1 MAG: hypothetical protein CSA57_12385 [candidate division KSB3 bacterium]